MADEVDHIVETPGTYPETVTLIKESDAVKGGAEGIANKQGTELANRTAYLRTAVLQTLQIVSHYMPQGVKGDLNFAGGLLGLSIQELNLQVSAEAITATTLSVSLQSTNGTLADVDLRVMASFGATPTLINKVLSEQSIGTEKLFLFDAVNIADLPFIKVVIIHDTKWWEFVVNISQPTGKSAYCTLEPKSMPTIT